MEKQQHENKMELFKIAFEKMQFPKELQMWQVILLIQETES
jgi:hypothetical protein